MSKIFAGMLFIFLNFDINLPTSTIGLIPSFIGYFFMLKGLTELSGFSRRFTAIRPTVMIMLVYSVIIYVINLLGAPLVDNEPRTIVLGLVSTILSLFISYNIVMGVNDIESTSGQDLASVPLYDAWKLLAVFSFIPYAVFFIPVLAVISIIIGFIVAIYYLYTFRNTSNLFYAQSFEMTEDPRPAGKGSMIVLLLAVILGCAGAFIYSRHIVVYRTSSPCGNLQVSFNRASGMLSQTGVHRSTTMRQQRQVYNPVFMWSPCGRYLALNYSDYWNRHDRRAVIINLAGTWHITKDRMFIHNRYEETRTPVFVVYERVEIVEWLDSENLLFNFSWPYDSTSGISMYGWFTWHFPTWTITELVIQSPPQG